MQKDVCTNAVVQEQKSLSKSKPVSAEIRKTQGTVEYLYHRLETIM